MHLKFLITVSAKRALLSCYNSTHPSYLYHFIPNFDAYPAGRSGSFLHFLPYSERIRAPPRTTCSGSTSRSLKTFLTSISFRKSQAPQWLWPVSSPSRLTELRLSWFPDVSSALSIRSIRYKRSILRALPRLVAGPLWTHHRSPLHTLAAWHDGSCRVMQGFG